MALRLRAPAKINLDLRVLGKRVDGFHELRTVFHSLELHDWLLADLGGTGIELEIGQQSSSGLAVGCGADNLVVRAAQAYLAAADLDLGLRFRLDKQIPAGGGLGGGSSDAAAALRLCHQLSGQALSQSALGDLGRGLGADVAFFLEGGTKIGTGRGDALRSVPVAPRYEVLLILPPSGASTPEVYKNHKAQLIDATPATTLMASDALFDQQLAPASEFRNDLEASAMELYPELRALFERVRALGFEDLRMSGSGSTLFLVFSDRAAADAAREALLPVEREGVSLVRTATDARDLHEPEVVAWPDPC